MFWGCIELHEMQTVASDVAVCLSVMWLTWLWFAKATNQGPVWDDGKGRVFCAAFANFLPSGLNSNSVSLALV